MPIQQAVKMAERIIKISPYAIENFIVAHDFASEKKTALTCQPSRPSCLPLTKLNLVYHRQQIIL